MMKMKKTGLVILLAALTVNLAACSSKQSKKTSNEPLQTNTVIKKNDHQDVRLKFNQIKTAKAADQFKGGTSLEQLKALFGEPVKQEQVPAGDVMLDSYTWRFDSVEVSAQLFQDSTIARSISNFKFDRKATITKVAYDKLASGVTYAQAVEFLGEPDMISETSSSDKESLQAIWVSGLKTNAEDAQISLTFEKNTLTEKTQKGLE